MNLILRRKVDTSSFSIQLPTSKSECNRTLIIQQLIGESNLILKPSESDDSQILISILNQFNTTSSSFFDVGPAGTTIRFLTAYFSFCEGTQILTGSLRMKNRPIGILVDALMSIGATISYLEKDGFPPIEIKPPYSNLSSEVFIDGSVSSQFISALMLVAPSLPNGLLINIQGELVSLPYLKMTQKLMSDFGVPVIFSDKSISIPSKKYSSKLFIVESDWSSASYWYEIVALSNLSLQVELLGLKKDSLQGDSVVQNIFTDFGVKTVFTDTGVILSKVDSCTNNFEYNFISCPDLAQTVAVTCAGLGISAKLFGLKTLKVKETDRILALVEEFSKVNVESKFNDDSLFIYPPTVVDSFISPIFETYDDHRMAMAFAPLALVFDEVTICNSEVVSKSYPKFFKDIGDVINVIS